MYRCDACRARTRDRLTHVQMQTGDLVAGKDATPRLRTQSREFYILCGPCGEYAVAALRQFIAAGGYEALDDRASAERAMADARQDGERRSS